MGTQTKLSFYRTYEELKPAAQGKGQKGKS